SCLLRCCLSLMLSYVSFLSYLNLFLFPSLVLLPPPRYLLFPYTTLFRSRSLGRTLSVARRNGPGQGFHRPRCRRRTRRGVARTLDRKSTRLNSSHVSISYAVFCLEKINIYFQYSRCQLLAV